MRHTPDSTTPSPGNVAPPLPAVPPQRLPVSDGTALAAPVARRTAFAEGVARLRRAATTEPGRLRLIGAVLAILVVVFGVVASWQASGRATAVDDVLTSSQPLTSDAAGIYRSLAHANTTASSGFLSGGQESDASWKRYERDIRTASEKLADAAANSTPGSPSAETITDLNRLLPEYKGLVERARIYHRQGYPVGGAYLRYANEKMQQKMLPAAEALYTTENRRLRSDYAAATPYPWLSIALGVVALAALAGVQRRTYLRTHRVFNRGLVTATACTALTLLWLTAGHTLARSHLNDSYEHGVRSLNVLHDARIDSLKARTEENLTLVARGAETTKVGETTYDAYDYRFGRIMDALATNLARAQRLADDDRGTEPVTAAVNSMTEWQKRHRAAREQDEYGNYEQALDMVVGGKGTTGECFDRIDGHLADALDHEETEFEQAATGGRNTLTGLPAGAAVLAVLGAAGAVAGIGRRLAEYR